MFLCQRDSFLTQCKTHVVSCTQIQNGDKLLDILRIEIPVLPNKLFELILEDSVLFPEGGGQPDDRGFIEDVPVIRVIRRVDQAIHYVIMSSAFKDKQEVSVRLVWERRFDHMQQHSVSEDHLATIQACILDGEWDGITPGQHLITAVADRLFGFETTSWWLGGEDSYIELDTKELSSIQLQDIENEVNLKIRENISVTVEVVELDSPKLKIARGRNLPEDIKGQIRIVTMDGVEANVCCGTHVSSLSQLQVIKLLFSEKRKGKSLLHFLVGNRVLTKLEESFQREQKLVQILKCSSAELVVGTEKLFNAMKTTMKCSQVLGKDLATLEAKTFMNQDDNGELWHYHRDNVDLDFGTAFLRQLEDTKKSLILVTIKTEGNSGYFMLRSSAMILDINRLGEKLCTILDGKGTARGRVYQAKVSRINAVNKALKATKEFINENKDEHSLI